MGREILFRAKRIDNGEWVEGYYAVVGKRHVIIKAQAEDYYTVENNLKKSHGNEVIEVDPETVCQYTGLTDRNGRKIFEGDIIDDIDYGIMKCIFLHGSFVWYKEDGFRIECMRYVPKIEVIGNIFDNPELIEVDGEREEY